MSREILFIRHAESTANADGVWEGRGDSPLTERGVTQARRLAGRLTDREVSLVVASPLQRARETALAVAAADVESDPDWREMDLGSWERLSRDEIARSDPEVLQALGRGEDVPFGGGERASEAAERSAGAFERVLAAVPEGGTAVVVTHGGIVQTLTARLIGIDRAGSWPLTGVVNTSITRIVVEDGTPRLAVYNDAAHLGGDHLGADRSATTLLLVRHGETAANVEGRWQGRSDWPLTGEGELQAARLAKAIDPVAAVYTSPLLRARATAEAVAGRLGLEVQVEPGIQEIAFGAWEDLRPDDIAGRWPDDWARFRGGEDIRRGGTGETFGEVRTRMTDHLASVARRHDGDAVAVVSHGGAIRAYVTGLLGLPFGRHVRVQSPANTSVARIVFTHRGPQLSRYNVVPGA